MNRSPRLCFLSLTEYGCLVNLIRSPYKGTEEDDIDDYVNINTTIPETNGRHSNTSFAFQSTYKLYDKYHHRLSSILRVPIYGGFKSVPKETKIHVVNGF